MARETVIKFPHHGAEVIYEPAPPEATEEVVESYTLGLPDPMWRKRDFRTPELVQEHKLQTPLDERGLVDADKLIERIRATVAPDFVWAGRCDRHHLLWPRADYAAYDEYDPEVRAAAFRNLPSNSIRVPRIFHNWVHAITVPPPMPDPEVMRSVLDEWAVVRDFFESVKETTTTLRIYERERERRMGTPHEMTEKQEELLRADIHRRLSGVVMHLFEMREVSLDWWTVTRNMKAHTAAGHIGQLVLDGWMTRTKKIQLPARALQAVA